MNVSVNELVKSSDGRRYLKKQQDLHRIDILQPKDKHGRENPEFTKVYGDKIRRDKLEMEKLERDSKGRWEDIRERKEFEKRDKTGIGKKYL